MTVCGMPFSSSRLARLSEMVLTCLWCPSMTNLPSSMAKPGEQFDGEIQTEGALLGEIHGLRGEVEMRYPDRRMPDEC